MPNKTLYRKKTILSFFVGFLFALGLGISGMTQPHKVIGFLDFFGNWDPSLIFVMLGAISVHFVAYRIAKHRESPLLWTQWHVPTKKELTPQLIIGSALFGIGWGLAGYCPGPAMTSISAGHSEPMVFVIMMFIGMALYRIVEKRIKWSK